MRIKDTETSFEVALELTLIGKRYTANGKLVLCPFCENREGDKEACGLCEGAGLLLKLKKPAKGAKLFVIQGGKA